MAKRLVDGELWFENWFSELPTKYKLLWLYIRTRCDTAGIFEPNLKMISRILNEDFIEEDCLNFFKEELKKVGDKWVILGFIESQYGLPISPKMVKPVNNCLSKIGYSIDTVSVLYGYSIDTPIRKGKGKGKGKESKKMIDDINIINNKRQEKFDFEAIWVQYPKQVGREEAEMHFHDTVKTEENFSNIQKAVKNYCKEVRGKESRYILNGDKWFDRWPEWVVNPNKFERQKEEFQEREKKEAKEAAAKRQKEIEERNNMSPEEKAKADEAQKNAINSINDVMAKMKSPYKI